MSQSRNVMLIAVAFQPWFAWAQSLPPGFKLKGVLPGPVSIACQDPPPPGASEPQCIVVAAPAPPAPPASRAAAASAAATPDAAPSAPASGGTETGASEATPAQKKNAFELVSEFGQMDLSVPSSPAFAVLGISPDKVQRPGTIRDFATSVVRGIGADGKPVNGVAIDMSPVSVFFKQLITGGSEYAPDADSHNDLRLKNYWKRAFARTTVSLATTSADSNGASKSAWGLRVGLIDQGDPGLYYKETAACLRKATMPPIKAGRDLTSTPADDAVNLCNPLTNGVMEKPLWAQPALYAGYGQSWYSKSGSLTDRAPDVKAFWLAGSYGMFVGKPTQELGALRTLLQGYLGRKLNDRTPDPNDATVLLREDSSDIIVRLKLGKDTWHGFLELGRSRVRLGNDTTEKLRHVALGAEFKLNFADDTWLQLASVSERGFSNGKDNTGVTMNLKFGVPFLELPGTKPGN